MQAASWQHVRTEHHIKYTGKSKEEWVTVIFGEDGKKIDGSDRKGVIAAKSSAAKKSVYDLNPDGEDFSGKLNGAIHIIRTRFLA